MKKCLLGAAVLAASLSAQAALHTGSDAKTVCVPSLKGGFQVGLTGAWMDTSYAQNYYAIQDQAISTGHPVGELVKVDFDHCFDYGIMVGYVIPNTGNDVRLSYFHIDHDKDDSVGQLPFQSEGQRSRLWTTYGQVDDDYVEFARSASANIEITGHNVDLEVGQHIDVGCNMDLRLFIGASYAEVDKKMSVRYIGEPGTQDAGRIEDVRLDSEFKGFGPRLGLDATYALGAGFGVVGHFAAAAYYGELDSLSLVSVPTSADQLGRVEQTSTNYKDEDAIVPGCDIRLALDYSYRACNGTVISLEGGYWVKHYFNGVSFIHLTGDGNGLFDNHITDNLQDIGFGGFYATLHAEF